MRAMVCAAMMMGMAWPAFGQTKAQQTEAMAAIQKQLDMAQAPQVPSAYLFGNTDGATVIGTRLYVFGYAFECTTGSTQGVELEVDGVIRPIAGYKPNQDRYDRPDVRPLYIGGCPNTPLATGALVSIDISEFDPTLPHVVALRYRNAAGIGRRFNGRFVYVCGYNPDNSPIVCHGPE